MDIRAALVQFMVLNPDIFEPYCYPLSVEAHTQKMRSHSIWGTHAEIVALSLYLGKPVFVALDKGNGKFYWAKYMAHHNTTLMFPLKSCFEYQVDLDHVELCHVNNNHYDVPVSSDGSIPHVPPYQGDVSTSSADPIIV